MRTIRNTQSMFDEVFLNSPLLDDVLSPEYLDYLRGPAQVQAVGAFGWGSRPGLIGFLEMSAWVRVGIPLETSFRAATLDNAKAFGLDDQLGTVESG